MAEDIARTLVGRIALDTHRLTQSLLYEAAVKKEAAYFDYEMTFSDTKQHDPAKAARLKVEADRALSAFMGCQASMSYRAEKRSLKRQLMSRLIRLFDSMTCYDTPTRRH